jgi:hypothetical protein
VANTLNAFRGGAVGFIDWLGAVGLGFIFGGATGLGVCYKLQLDTVFKKCLKTRKREREPLSRVGDVTEKLVAIARPTGLPDREERNAALYPAQAPRACRQPCLRPLMA